jgi:hypothetical protein
MRFLKQAVIPLLFISLCMTPVFAQTFSDLDRDFNDRSFRLFLRGTYIKPGADEVYHGWTINGALNMNSENMFGIRARYENPTLGDAFILLVHTIKGKPWATPSGLQHAYGGGWIGWMQFYWNVVATDRLLIAPGFSHADYIIGIEETDQGNIRLRDPAGYFFAAGPGLLTTYLVTDGIWVDGYVNYDLCYAKVKYSQAGYVPVEGYKKPHFITYGIDVNHRSGFFAGVRINQLIDRGPHNITARRTDISIGYHFKDRDR